VNVFGKLKAEIEYSKRNTRDINEPENSVKSHLFSAPIITTKSEEEKTKFQNLN
jgi:hypothetical protein